MPNSLSNYEEGVLDAGHKVRPAIVHAPGNSDAVGGGVGDAEKCFHRNLVGVRSDFCCEVRREI